MSDEVKSFPHVPGYAPHTLKVIDRLKLGKVGEVIPAAELNTIAGRDVTSDKHRVTFRNAARYVLRFHGIGWVWMRSADAVKCVNASELVACADARRKHIVRVSKRAAGELSVALGRGEELPMAERPRAAALLAQTMTLAAMGSTQTAKKLEARGVNAMPDPDKLLGHFVAGK